MAEQLKIGDLVRRDSEDIWRVLSVPESYDAFKDRARCICARAPLGWLKPDGTRSRSWAKVGDEDNFTIADLELLPDDALAAAEPADYAAPLSFPTTNRMLFAGAALIAVGDEDSPSIVSGEDAGSAEPRRIEIEQSRGPTIAFEGTLLCARTVEIPESDTPLKMAVYETTAGALIAVSSRPADGDGEDACIRASVVEVGDDAQTARFAVLDHFEWDREAQIMVRQLEWSLRREVA